MYCAAGWRASAGQPPFGLGDEALNVPLVPVGGRLLNLPQPQLPGDAQKGKKALEDGVIEGYAPGLVAFLPQMGQEGLRRGWAGLLALQGGLKGPQDLKIPAPTGGGQVLLAELLAVGREDVHGPSIGHPLGGLGIKQDTHPTARGFCMGPGEPVSRILCPPPTSLQPGNRAFFLVEGGGGHPSRTAVAGCLLRPTRGPGTARGRPTGRAPSGSSYLVLLRAGFTQPPGHPGAGELLPHHFTLTRPGASGMFLWHFP